MSRAWVLIAVGALLMAVGAGCTAEAPVAATAAPLPPGNLLPEDIETVLFGSPSSCREDADCPSHFCNYGACGGLISVDSRWMQERIAQVLVERVTERPALRERVEWHLVRVLRRPRTELALRARCVVGLELLGAWKPLEAALGEVPESVAEAVAMALARLGRAAGLAHASALTEADASQIAVEALRSLGASKLPDALPVLLAHLNPELEGELVRAALDGIAAHGDRRAVKPLVAFLDRAPEFLLVRTARTLRQLTGATISPVPSAWRAWIERNPPPDPPPYALRRYRTEDDIGLPTP